MRRLSQTVSGKGTLYVVPTHRGNPMPFVSPDGVVTFDRRWPEGYIEVMSWDRACQSLGQLRVQRVGIGGRYLAFREPRDDKDLSILNSLANLAKRHHPL